MRECPERDAAEIVAVARRFLERWQDPYTRAHRDDLVQDTALAACQGRHRLREDAKLPAFVRTIARRVRARALREEQRLPCQAVSLDDSPLDVPAREPDPGPYLVVGGREVRRQALLEALPGLVERLGGLNRSLLLSYHEGFSCAELAERFDLGEDAVKVRLHRGRMRIRREFESRQRTAD